MLTQGWGDFITWLEGHQASAEVFVAIAALAVTGALVFVTISYVRAARRQAEASVLMAAEMREARHGQVMPVVDIVLEPLTDTLEVAIAVAKGAFPQHMWARVKNAGVGPALDLRFQTKLNDMGPNWHDVGHLGVGEVVRAEIAQSERWPVYLEPVEERVRRLSVEYHNVYGKRYESWRDVTFDPAGPSWKIGPLHTRS